MHIFFVFKQKTAYDMRISDWSSDVCSSDLDDSIPSVLEHSDDFQRTGSQFSQQGVRKFRQNDGTELVERFHRAAENQTLGSLEIGRASCRERVCQYV